MFLNYVKKTLETEEKKENQTVEWRKKIVAWPEKRRNFSYLVKRTERKREPAKCVARLSILFKVSSGLRATKVQSYTDPQLSNRTAYTYTSVFSFPSSNVEKEALVGGTRVSRDGGLRYISWRYFANGRGTFAAINPSPFLFSDLNIRVFPWRAILLLAPLFSARKSEIFIETLLEAAWSR